MAAAVRRAKQVTGSVPSFPVSLSFETAAALEHLINAQSVIAQSEKEQGRVALSESVERLTPFWNALISYLDNPNKQRTNS